MAGTYMVIFTDNNQCKDSATVVVADSTTVGLIESLKPNININIYPNPSSGSFNIKIDENIEEVILIDVNGKIVFKKHITVNGIIPIETNIPKGVYYVLLKGVDFEYVDKVIITD